MSDKIVAISSEVVQCGKKISDSKKKFVWRFRIGDTTYNLQLISSAISGKRVITLNDQPIYSQQSVLNIKFDFNHNLKGHSLRIFRQLQSVHAYDLRIDNRSFEYLLKKKDSQPIQTKTSGKYQAQANDPFSQFQKAAVSSGNNNNNFGEFDDFASFDFSNKQKKPSNEQKKVQPKKNQFDIDFNQNSSGIKAQKFETNNFNNLENNMKNLDLLSADNFTTNNYGNYNNYIDLIDASGGTSETWGVETEPKKKTILQQIKPDITGKQIINKTVMTAVQIKKKAVKQFQSLI